MAKKTTDPGDNDFYVGYLPRTPAATKNRVTIAVLLFTASAFFLAFFVARSQLPADPGVYDFGALDTFEGTLDTTPYPTLLKDGRRYLLVAQGKHGAEGLLQASDINKGAPTRVIGAKIEAPAGSMIEIAEAHLGSGPPEAPTGAIPLGRQTLVGEIVDSKCYLGVMKPGRGKPHRACAALCIEGGIPPALLVRTETEQQILILTGPKGEALGSEVLDFVAEPIEIEGLVSTRGGQLYLSVELSDIRRLNT